MSNPAFIVDGFSEKLVIGQLCPGQPIRRTDLNGKSVTIEAIANKIASLIRLFNNRYYPIIVVFDREQRKKSFQELSDELNAELKKLGLEGNDIRVAVADRMFENWIIADWDSLNVEKPKPENTDGTNGCSILKSALDGYHKTTDGVEMFIKANPAAIYKNSASFKYFIDLLEGVDCNYIEFEK